MIKKISKVIIDVLTGIVFAILALIIASKISMMISGKNYFSVFGYSVFTIATGSMEPVLKQNDIVIVKKQGQNKYEVGENVFFYSGNKITDHYVNFGELNEITPNVDAEYAYKIGEKKISYSNLVGSESKTTVIHGWGLLLSVLESKWGFMFFVILPTLFALVYEIYSLVVEAKEAR